MKINKMGTALKNLYQKNPADFPLAISYITINFNPELKNELK